MCSSKSPFIDRCYDSVIVTMSPISPLLLTHSKIWWEGGGNNTSVPHPFSSSVF